MTHDFIIWLSSQMSTPWVWVGLFGQMLFTARFLVQWIHSEKQGRSTVPEMFWYLSLAGGLIVLIYAIQKRDLVFILAQSFGSFIYLRNIQLIRRHRRRMTMDSHSNITSSGQKQNV